MGEVIDNASAGRELRLLMAKYETKVRRMDEVEVRMRDSLLQAQAASRARSLLAFFGLLSFRGATYSSRCCWPSAGVSFLSHPPPYPARSSTTHLHSSGQPGILPRPGLLTASAAEAGGNPPYPPCAGASPPARSSKAWKTAWRCGGGRFSRAAGGRR